jgi:hypothetical protein
VFGILAYKPAPYGAIQWSEVMLLKVTSGSVPVGNYAAKLTAVDKINHAEYGPGLKFSFEVLKGPQAGQKVSRTTGLSPTPRNAAGKLLSSMLGRTLTLDEQVNVADLIGREFFVIVGAGQGESTRVETAVPVAPQGE